jgi:cytochrome c5
MHLERLLNSALLASLSIVSVSAIAADDRSEVLERIKRVGVVAVTGQPAPAEKPVAATKPAEPAATAPQAAEAAPAAAPAAAPQTAASGEARYKSTCLACHATGAAGAPKLEDKANWQPRIAKGMDALYQSAINGIRAMPPRGTCGACSDDELKAVVDYMVSQAK